MQYTRPAAVRGGLVAGLFLVTTAVLTGLIPNPVFDRYVPRSPVDVLFLLSTALLLGGYSTQRYTRVDCSRSAPAFLGGLGGAFAVSCPYCIPVLAGTLGASAVATYLVPMRSMVGLVSVAVLAGVLVVRQRRLVTEGPAVSDVALRCPTCGMVLKEAVDEPEPEVEGDRMRIDVDCPGCDDPLVVLVEPALGDDLDVRKRVERKAERSGQSCCPGPYAVAPSDQNDQE